MIGPWLRSYAEEDATVHVTLPPFAVLSCFINAELVDMWLFPSLFTGKTDDAVSLNSDQVNKAL